MLKYHIYGSQMPELLGRYDHHFITAEDQDKVQSMFNHLLCLGLSLDSLLQCLRNFKILGGFSLLCSHRHMFTLRGKSRSQSVP